MRVIAVAVGLMISPVWAADWTALDGAGIAEALTGRSLDYGHATQDFRASGGTDYFSGRPSTGRWEVRRDQYCSVWPPSDQWACYDVEMSADGMQVRFHVNGSDESIGTYIGSK